MVSGAHQLFEGYFLISSTKRLTLPPLCSRFSLLEDEEKKPEKNLFTDLFFPSPARSLTARSAQLTASEPPPAAFRAIRRTEWQRSVPGTNSPVRPWRRHSDSACLLYKGVSFSQNHPKNDPVATPLQNHMLAGSHTHTQTHTHTHTH